MSPAGLSPNLKGTLLMILAMAGFAIEDLIIKFAAMRMPVGQVMLVMGLGGALIFAAMARRRGEAVLSPAYLARGLVFRSVFEVAGRLFYALAIALTPLSTTSAILQATPLVVVAGAALVFGERVTPGRWLAVLTGFIGVMIILRPGTEGFSLLSLLAVAGMLGFAGRDLATRAARNILSNRQLGVIGFSMLALAGAIVLAVSGGARLPDATGALLLAGCTIAGTLGYHALTGAMRSGEISVVTPFRYTRLIFAIILAMIFLKESLEPHVILGALLIVAAGLSGLIRR